MIKPDFCICQNKGADKLHSVTVQLIRAFVFATQIVKSLYFLQPKFQDSNHILWLYSLINAGPCQNFRKQVFLRQGSNNIVWCCVYSLYQLRLVFDDDMIILSVFLKNMLFGSNVEHLLVLRCI